MLYERDKLLEDLRNSVIAISLRENMTVRCTMKQVHLPPKYLEEQQGEREFHRAHPQVLKVWDIEHRRWQAFDISAVEYCEDISDRY